ncbi:CLUMA_CG014255, isoform A [Clunio marinus]|uniref:CLUMA_CG014255, isoform A n=1 Tax=Clunio marinus TaxID=568069 RepID=A0A1J1IM74_9DIPT|nr:CLUMA_CG014255, isoform A [Clunio marinus]
MFFHFSSILIVSLLTLHHVEASLKEFIKFERIEYEELPATGNFQFDPYNNVPQGFAPYTSKRSPKVFVAVPRRSQGVPSTLNYVKLEEGRDLYVNPKLHSYPNYEMNELDPSNKPSSHRIVSVYRPRVDECERLWFVDIGVSNTSGIANIIQQPSIWVIDLKNDSVINRYEIPPSDAINGLGLANLAVDVISCDGNSFAYLPNLITSQIIVYNLEKNQSYTVQHNYFHMHPFEGDYNVDGLRFTWDDGIFSIALAERDKNSSYRLAYFHPMSSFSEFAVSTEVLQNETLATRSYHGDDFKLVGNRGKNSQSTMHEFHEKSGTLFFAEINQNAVTCWNSKRSLKPSRLGTVAKDNLTLIYPSDLKVVEDDLWVLSNRMIRHIYSKLDTDGGFNFRIFRTSVKDAIADTKCKQTSKLRETFMEIKPQISLWNLFPHTTSKWNSIRYKNIPISWDTNVYDAYVNVPFGMTRYRDKLFVTIPRRNPGIPSSLNVVELVGNPPYINPMLISYPNFQTNALDPLNRADSSKIVSVYRPRVDRCDRLWFVDTGVLEYTNNQINVQRPSIWTVDLKTNNLIGRFEIPSSVVPDGKGLASITLDDDDCANTFAYVTDWFNRALIVYSAQQNRAWRFNNNYFHFNPFEGDFSIDGIQFQWSDGLFSVALSTTKPNGYRTAFFHPLSSTAEFTVTTEILRNETLASRRVHGNDFKHLGTRGYGTQSGTHFYDLNSNVIFFAEMQKNAISCWNVKKPLKPANIHLVAQNNSTMIYPSDVFIDNESTLWVLSNRLPRFIYDRYNSNEFNFNIFRGNVNEILRRTSCLL